VRRLGDVVPRPSVRRRGHDDGLVVLDLEVRVGRALGVRGPDAEEGLQRLGVPRVLGRGGDAGANVAFGLSRRLLSALITVLQLTSFSFSLILSDTLRNPSLLFENRPADPVVFVRVSAGWATVPAGTPTPLSLARRRVMRPDGADVLDVDEPGVASVWDCADRVRVDSRSRGAMLDPTMVCVVTSERWNDARGYGDVLTMLFMLTLLMFECLIFCTSSSRSLLLLVRACFVCLVSPELQSTT